VALQLAVLGHALRPWGSRCDGAHGLGGGGQHEPHMRGHHRSSRDHKDLGAEVLSNANYDSPGTGEGAVVLAKVTGMVMVMVMC
jgi:hypothetical protein